jgi:hypothetical protein
MTNDAPPGIKAINTAYIVDVYILTVLLPFAAITIEAIENRGRISTDVIEKWFVLFAVGIRFLRIGIRQAIRVKLRKEHGLASLSFGMVAVVSFFIPSWRIVCVFGSGLYYGSAAFSCFLKKSTSSNETFTKISNLCIFLILLIFLLVI